MAPDTVKILKNIGIPTGFIDLIAVRTLRGSVSIYANYMGITGGGDVT